MTIVLSFVVSTSKFSRLFISIARLSPISSFIFSQAFVLSKRIYMIVNNLFHMFAKKFKLINLSHRQNRFFFSLVIEICKFCNFIFLFIVKSIKIEILTLYHDSTKRRLAHSFFASFRFSTFAFFVFFFGSSAAYYRFLSFL